MKVQCRKRGSSVIAELSGELDHHSASKIRSSLDTAIDDSKVTELVLDMSQVTFMDSSGLGVILGRYKKLHERGGTLKIIGADGHIKRIMKMSGVYSLIAGGR